MNIKNKILIIGPAWVGDMMMTNALFQLLHQQDPTVEIHVLAPAWSQALIARMPGMTSNIIVSPFTHGQLRLRDRYRFAKQVRQHQYTQAIVIPNSVKSALIPFWALIPKRTGWMGEYRFGLLNDLRFLNKKALPRQVERFAALALSAEIPMPMNWPIPKLTILSHDVDAALKKHALQKPTKLLMALCPGAEHGPAKRWPPSYYAAVANQKLSEGWDVWLFGSPNDCAVGDEIQTLTQNRCMNLIGKTILAEAVDLLSLANLVVANDSGLMHVSAALGIPVVAIYGSTPSEFAPPLSSRAKIMKTQLDCQPCRQPTCPLKHHACMQTLHPTVILNAIDELLHTP